MRLLTDHQAAGTTVGTTWHLEQYGFAARHGESINTMSGWLAALLPLIDTVAQAYDAGGKHSTMELAKTALSNAARHFPSKKMTLGLPFYARNVRSGNWISYEDIVQRLVSGSRSYLDPSIDMNGDDYFNGVTTIQLKTALAVQSAAAGAAAILREHLVNIDPLTDICVVRIFAGGVMVWEAGQDCRLAEVRHGNDVHVQTCPSREWSLFNAIKTAFEVETDRCDSQTCDASTTDTKN